MKFDPYSVDERSTSCPDAYKKLLALYGTAEVALAEARQLLIDADTPMRCDEWFARQRAWLELHKEKGTR